MSDKPSENVTRWATLYEAVTGATSATSHHHEDAPGTNEKSIEAGHEPDRFDAKGIILVPIGVVITAFIAYVIVSVLFGQFEFGAPDKSNVQNPQAAELAARPFNERVATISSSDPKAASTEPRLEYMKNLDTSRNGKTDDPPYVRSFQAADTGNSPVLTPRDLYPDRFVDPQTGKKLLADYEYVNKDKTLARIPVADAMAMVVRQARNADAKRHAEAVKKAEAEKKDAPDPKAPLETSAAKAPKLSNGGQAVGDGPAK